MSSRHRALESGEGQHLGDLFGIKRDLESAITADRPADPHAAWVKVKPLRGKLPGLTIPQDLRARSEFAIVAARQEGLLSVVTLGSLSEVAGQ